MKVKVFTLKVIIVVFFLTPIQALSHIYYLPHIHTGSDTWETYLIIDRAYGSNFNRYQLILYSQSGSEITRINGTLNESNIKIPLRSYGGSSGILILKENTTRVRLSYIAKDSSGGGTAEFTAETQLASYIMLNLSNYYDKLNWSGFALFNGSNKSIQVDSVAYKNGQSVSSKSFTMAAHSKKVAYFEDFFGLNSFTDIDYVLFYTDSKALTGIVISGKDNDKLLFSQGKEIYIYSPLKHKEVFETGTIQKEIIPSEQLFTYLKTANGAYLKPITGNEFDNLPIGGQDINPFSFKVNGATDDIFISGVNNNRFVIKKVNSQASLVWEKEVGDCSGQTELEQNRDLNNIPIALTHNGNLITAFYDSQLKQTIIKTLKQDDGSVLNSITLSHDNCMVYKGFSNYYDDTIFFAAVYTEGGKYKIALLEINNDGSLKQEYSSESPVNSNRKNVFFDCVPYSRFDEICMVLGVKLSETDTGNNYSLHILTLSTSDFDFSNAGILPIKGVFLPEGSKVYTGYTDNYGPNLLTVFTSPYNDFQPSIKIGLRLNLDNHTIQGISDITYFPYKITGVFFVQEPYFYIFITSNTKKCIIPGEDYYIEYQEKTLTGLE